MTLKKGGTEFLFNKTNRCTNFPDLFLLTNYMFRAVPLPIIKHNQDGTPWSSILVMLESCHQTCMTYTSAECTVENS